jgi:hypothetical protein
VRLLCNNLHSNNLLFVGGCRSLAALESELGDGECRPRPISPGDSRVAFVFCQNRLDRRPRKLFAASFESDAANLARDWSRSAAVIVKTIEIGAHAGRERSLAPNRASFIAVAHRTHHRDGTMGGGAGKPVVQAGLSGGRPIPVRRAIYHNAPPPLFHAGYAREFAGARSERASRHRPARRVSAAVACGVPFITAFGHFHYEVSFLSPGGIWRCLLQDFVGRHGYPCTIDLHLTSRGDSAHRRILDRHIFEPE